MAKKEQFLPHVGIRKEWFRQGKVITADTEPINGRPTWEATSIRRAKRMMRTGSPERK